MPARLTLAVLMDPLESIKERDFDSLLGRIANLAPAPVGLGNPWKKAN